MSQQEPEGFDHFDPLKSLGMPQGINAQIALILYRQNEIEGDVKSLHQKFDGVAVNYVNQATLMLTLAPMKEDIRDLQDKDKSREDQKTGYSAQLRLALIAAALAPFGSIIAAVAVSLILEK